MEFLYSLLSVVISVLFAIVTPLSTITGQSLRAKDEENVKLCFSSIADTHVTESKVRYTMLKQAFNDMSCKNTPLDAVVLAGDLTDHGEKVQFDNFFSAIKAKNKIERVIMCTGNHDTWSDEGWDAGNSYFMDGYNELTGSNITKPYYSTTVNGYTFITLASEGDNTYAYISEEQIEWLDSEMLTASASGLPIFVICHFPINGTNGQAQIWEGGGMGEQSDAVLEVMKKYENVFYITGHLHAGLTGSITMDEKGYSSIENDGSLHFVNLPCYMYLNTDAGNPVSGCGFVFEVYEDSVLIRARNFAMSKWYPIYETEIELV